MECGSSTFLMVSKFDIESEAALYILDVKKMSLIIDFFKPLTLRDTELEVRGVLQLEWTIQGTTLCP
jgi:hypothetical protein